MISGVEVEGKVFDFHIDNIGHGACGGGRQTDLGAVTKWDSAETKLGKCSYLF